MLISRELPGHAFLADHDAQPSPESRARLRLSRPRNTDRRMCLMAGVWFAPEPHCGGGGHESEVSVGDWECAEAAIPESQLVSSYFWPRALSAVR
jgi:hypothetical protein